MPAALGDHAPRLRAVRALLAPKSRRGAEHFIFEGATLLEEARRSGLPLDAVYVTSAAYERFAVVRELETAGVAVYTIGERALRRISDVETPSGIVAVGRRRIAALASVLAGRGAVLALADLADPGNAGTLVRSAEAFGAAGVVFGTRGVDPYHPKVVRAAMGSLFRLPIALAAPAEAAQAAAAAGRALAGLDAEGALEVGGLPASAVLVVGQERRGLGAWREHCAALYRIPAPGPAESLNAAVAGAIALYEASRRRPE